MKKQILRSIIAFIALFCSTQALSQTINTFAGIPGFPGYSGDLSAATSAQLGTPSGLAIDQYGNIYIADPTYNVVRKVDTNGIITTFAGNGSSGYAGDGSLAIHAKLNNPVAVTCDRTGRVYIADNGNYVVRVVDPSGNINTYAGTGTPGFSGGGGLALSTPFRGVNGIAVDTLGNVYISDGSAAIFEVQTAGPTVVLYGGGSHAGYGGDGGPATSASFNGTAGLALDEFGNLYIADNLNNAIRKIDVGDSVTTVAGNGSSHGSGSGDYCGDHGPATAACLFLPNGVFVDQCGNIYIADQGNQIIRRVDAGTGIITTVAGTPSSLGYSGDGGPATSALLNNPSDIVLDSAGNMYIADKDNNIVRNVNSVSALSVTPSPADSICSGGSVTFTATYTSSDCSTIIHWYVNRVISPTTGSVFTVGPVAPAPADTVVAVLTTFSGKVLATSDSNIIQVVAAQTPSVSVTVSPGDTLCAGLTDTFTAIPFYGGDHPVYTWYVNSVSVYTGSGTYSYIPANGDTVYCTMVSDYACTAGTGTASSKHKVISTNPSVAPTISISSVEGDTTCAGNNVHFISSITNGGSSPAYNWEVNGVPTGGTSSTYFYGPASGDVVTCVLTSNAFCAVPDSVISDTITMTVTSRAIPTATISTIGSDTICSGSTLSFSVTGTDTGGSPSYYWYINGAFLYTGNVISYIPSDADLVYCVLYSNGCVSVDTARSNTIEVNVNTSVTPYVSITSSADTVCSGTPVSFNASGVNAGPYPVYVWEKNSTVIGTGSSISYTPSNNDTVKCLLISSAPCAMPDTVTSDSIVLYVTPSIVPSVSVTLNTSDTVCAGTYVTYTATATGATTLLTYIWYNNGVFEASGNTYSYYPVSGDSIVCMLTTTAICVFPDTAYSDTIAMTVNPVLTPSISIAVSPGGNVCAGTPVTFTVIPVNPGSSPVFNWKKNGTYIATGSSYSFTPVDGDRISCTMLSSAPCITSDSVMTSIFTLTVNPIYTPSVSIAVSPGDSICAGMTATFTATPIDAGSTPTYVWSLGGVPSGTGATYTLTPASGDVVSCVVTTSYICPAIDTAISNSITLGIIPLVTPSVSISVLPGDSICAGTRDSFTTTVFHGGPVVTYSWRVNDTASGIASTYGFFPTNGDSVMCVIISSAECATNDTAISNTIHIAVTTPRLPSVSLIATPGGTICLGGSVSITATPTLGGTAPVYEWLKNGSVVAGDTTSFYTFLPHNGDTVFCILSGSNAFCLATDTARSITIPFTVDSFESPSVSFTTSGGDTLCAGTPVTFNANGINAGSSPVFEWNVNGVYEGTGSTFNYTPTNGDSVFCTVISNYQCAFPDSASSGNVKFTVDSAPTVSITASPDTAIYTGDTVTFTATVSDGAAIPAFQWEVNGIPVTGATTNTFICDTLSDHDTVTCLVYGNMPCMDTVQSNIEVIINLAVPKITMAGNDLSLIPNPNKGTFTISGTLTTASDVDMTFEVTDMLGKAIYQQTHTIKNGKVNTQISLGDNLADGVYLLHISSGVYTNVFHVVIDK